METVIDKVYQLLINCGIDPKTIVKNQNFNHISFKYNKIEYGISIEDEFNLAYGPDELENGMIDSDYLHDEYSEYGELDDLEDYVYFIINENPFQDLYTITESLAKLENIANKNDIDFHRLLNNMYPYG